MKHLLPFLALGPLTPLLVDAAGLGPIATDYTAERSLRVETATTMEIETVDFSIERDGEPMDFGGGGEQSTTDERRTVVIDTVLEHEDGRPMRVRRVFETVEGQSANRFGDQSRDIDYESQFDGITLEIAVDAEGETEVEVVDGSEPDTDGALDGHRPGLSLDALLPDGEVAVGDTWDLDDAAIQHALGLDMRRVLFQRPEREDSGDERRRGRGGRGGGGGSTAGIFSGEWRGKATLAADDDDVGGLTCVRIDIEIESSGELPEPEWGGGGGRRGRAPSAASVNPAGLLESSYDVEAEGQVWFSVAQGCPVRAEVEGTVSTERNTERERGESVMTIYVAREGTWTHTVEIGIEAKDEE